MIFTCVPTLKEFVGGTNFISNEEVKDGFRQWLNVLAAEVYDDGIQKLVTGYDMCLNVDGDYVEKFLRVCNNDTLNVLNFYLIYFSL